MSTAVRRWWHGPWRVPTLAAVLILAAVLVARTADAGPVSDLLMVAAAVVAGPPIARTALRALVARHLSIDLLVSVAAGGAIIIGEYWEAAAVTALFAIGHALEARTLAKTRSALSELVASAPDAAVVMRDGQQVEVPAASVRTGETVLVKNGAKVPVDGVVVRGSAALDEASITGESIPAEKASGDRVFAGTISRGGFLEVEARGVGADTTLARIIHRVEEAQDAKARTQVFMDRFATWYTPGIMALAVVVGLVTRDVVLALTLLVIACPGALVISIPVSVVAGIGRAARDGILIKGGEHLEATARVDAVALDKTGTLTEGSPELTDVVALADGATRADVLRWAARAEAGSEHPLARPVLDAAAAEGLASPELPERTQPVPGKGVVAWVGGRRVAVGSAALLAELGVAVPAGAAEAVETLAANGRTPMLVAVDEEVLGTLAVADRVRASAATMVAALRAVGVREVVMLTAPPPRSPRRSALREGSTGSTQVCCPRTSWRRCGPCNPRAIRSRWWATASTTPRRWRAPTSGSRWAPLARPSPSRPPTSRSWVRTCSPCPPRSRWPGAPCASCVRTSSSRLPPSWRSSPACSPVG